MSDRGVSWHLVGRPRIPDEVKRARGQRLRDLRTELGWTQEELAQRAGFSQHTQISQLETGSRGLTGADALGRLSLALGVDVGRLHHYLDGDIPVKDFARECTPGVARVPSPWQRAELRTEEARPALEVLYRQHADAEFIRGFVHRVNAVATNMSRQKWLHYARTQLDRWNTLDPKRRDQSLEAWLRSKRPPLHRLTAEAMRQAFPPGIPSIEDWDNLRARIDGLRVAKRGAGDEPTAAELVELLRHAAG